eukprot:CAMPEP_0176057774 /NCGR_PEP_ID=MMETSP0120_2-20121206/28777_1 /TAXON_ID=160619 /ORGANISM="Kryptoperidinium foliaceum, Strain CCMP 1326" /LENGTH=76 /DNA_ID=CAMNT_0017391287 /DNA_START=11 /DNA_END=237 /DNA_ORIENTATION=+
MSWLTRRRSGFAASAASAPNATCAALRADPVPPTRRTRLSAAAAATKETRIAMPTFGNAMDILLGSNYLQGHTPRT